MARTGGRSAKRRRRSCNSSSREDGSDAPVESDDEYVQEDDGGDDDEAVEEDDEDVIDTPARAAAPRARRSSRASAPAGPSTPQRRSPRGRAPAPAPAARSGKSLEDTVVMDHPEDDRNETPEDSDLVVVLRYPPGPPQAEAIELFRDNILSLMPRTWMQGNIGDLYLRVLLRDSGLSELGKCERFEDLARRAHIFPTGFFTMFSRRRLGSRMRRGVPGDVRHGVSEEEARLAWAELGSEWKPDTIFEKDYLIVPVNESNMHWTLAIVCHPRELAQRAAARSGELEDAVAADGPGRSRPCVIVLDSLGGERRIGPWIGMWMGAYLGQAWAALRGGEHLTLREATQSGPADLHLVYPGVPLQPNSNDCGYYMLALAREFLKRAVCLRTLTVCEQDVANSFADYRFESWFDQREIVRMKLAIVDLIEAVHRGRTDAPVDVSEQELDAARAKAAALHAAAAAAAADLATKKRQRRDMLDRQIARLQAERDALESDADTCVVS